MTSSEMMALDAWTYPTPSCALLTASTNRSTELPVSATTGVMPLARGRYGDVCAASAGESGDEERPIDALQSAYELRDAIGMERFIESDSDVFMTLQESAGEIRRIFGPRVRPWVEVVFNPENKQNTILVTVATNKSITASVASLRKFHKEWWGKIGQGKTRRIAWIVG